MRIAYRRMSGAVGLSDEEPGTRGAWLEKRRALLALLQQHGHDVEIVGRMSRASGGVKLPWQPPYDLLMVEFGGGNKIFNGKDLEETLSIVRAHEHGRHSVPKIFLCDDPDLDFIWSELAHTSGWTVWNNSLTAAPLPKQKNLRVLDYPFSWNAHQREPITQVFADKTLAYIGRPGGRTKAIKALLADKVPFTAYAKPEEWREHPGVRVLPPPAQAVRGDFYAQQLGCLALADAKHKKLAWRTGRAFHALAAGCPALAERDHPGLAGFPTYARPREAAEWADSWLAPGNRDDGVRVARECVLQRDADIAQATLAACGL